MRMNNGRCLFARASRRRAARSTFAASSRVSHRSRGVAVGGNHTAGGCRIYPSLWHHRIAADKVHNSTVSSVLAGFLGSATAILFSIRGARVIKKLEAAGYFGDLIHYLISAIACSLILLVLSVGGFFIEPPHAKGAVTSSPQQIVGALTPSTTPTQSAMTATSELQNAATAVTPPSTSHEASPNAAVSAQSKTLAAWFAARSAEQWFAVLWAMSALMALLTYL